MTQYIQHFTMKSTCVFHNVTAGADSEAIDRKARSDGPRLHTAQIPFVPLIISPINPPCDPFLGNERPGQSLGRQPSRATVQTGQKSECS